jgi:predicted flap endonuclease-1-like 5' DNA nuclease
VLYTFLKFLGWGLLLSVVGGCVGWALRSLKCRGEVARVRATTVDADEVERMRHRLANVEQVVAERNRLRMQVADMRHADSPGVVLAPGEVALDAEPPVEVAEPEGEAARNEAVAEAPIHTDDEIASEATAGAESASEEMAVEDAASQDAAADETAGDEPLVLDTETDSDVVEASSTVAGFADVAAEPSHDETESDDEPSDDTSGDDTGGKSHDDDGVMDAAELDLAAAESVLGKKIRLDDLSVVEGIGPKISELCRGIGIETWRQLAQTDVPTLQSMLDAAGSRFQVHKPGTWPKQAELLAAGRWAEFKQLTDELDGGR